VTSKIYGLIESDITWLASGGSAVFTPTSLAASTGRQGALYDFGTSAAPRIFTWRAWVKFATTPVVGETIDIYLKTSDGSHPDNDDGTGDAAVSAEDKLKNLIRIGSITVDEASTTPEFAASGEIAIYHRYGAPVFWNATVDALSSTAADHGFKLTEVPAQAQAA
jgi:hypothetical protein